MVIVVFWDLWEATEFDVFMLNVTEICIETYTTKGFFVFVFSFFFWVQVGGAIFIVSS